MLLSADAVSAELDSFLGCETSSPDLSVPRWLQFPEARYSDTVAIDAACHLLQRGCFRIKEIAEVNVKQATVLLHLACWLQQLLSLRWREHGKLSSPLPAHFAKTESDAQLLLAVIGPAGTGSDLHVDRNDTR